MGKIPASSYAEGLNDGRIKRGNYTFQMGGYRYADNSYVFSIWETIPSTKTDFRVFEIPFKTRADLTAFWSIFCNHFNELNKYEVKDLYDYIDKLKSHFNQDCQEQIIWALLKWI